VTAFLFDVNLLIALNMDRAVAALLAPRSRESDFLEFI